MTSHFGPLVGISDINISGAAAATTGLPKYLDFYVVVDTSGSMGISTSAADQQLLIETNPDNPIEAAAGYQGGCQFACHFTGYQGFTYTQTNNIPLKLNSVGASLQALLDYGDLLRGHRQPIPRRNLSVHRRPDRGRVVVLRFPPTPPPIQSPAPNLANYLDQGTTNGGMGSGGGLIREFVERAAVFSANPGDRPQLVVDLAFHYSDHRRRGQRPDLYQRQLVRWSERAAGSEPYFLQRRESGRLYGGCPPDPL